jgi:ribonuclease-3
LTDFVRLMQKIGYTFENKSYLKQALTHRSAHAKNNERFEFLGDAVLSAIISRALYFQYPLENEGQLSRLRANLVKGEMLADLATELNLGDFLILGPGELKSGGFRRASILADALEAMIAAVFFDGGYSACETVVLKLFQSRLKSSLQHLNVKDPKTQLQEYLQAKKLPLPEYTLTQTIEHDQESTFYVTCSIQQLNHSAKGQGATRRKAEQEAAETLLKSLKK